MKYIRLSKGQIAVVDDADFDKVMAVSRSWHFNRGKAAACVGRRPNKRYVAMHRVILGLPPGQVPEVDHINGTGTDNRRSNLRVCDRSGNCANRRGWGKTSKYKGVYRQAHQKTGRVWKASITTKGRRVTLGYFHTEEEAHAAYCEAARKYHGEFARVA